jgi:cell division protein FtsX
MNDQRKTIIGAKTAFLLYAVLIGFAIATLKGTALAIAVIIVLAVAVKSYIDYLRQRLE